MDTTVLIVDDDTTLVQTLRDALELEGITAIGLEDPNSIGATVQQVTPDIILMDLMLAAQSGIELAAELRDGPLANVPRLAMSASPFLLEIADESELFSAVIPKPVDVDALLELIASHMGEQSPRE